MRGCKVEEARFFGNAEHSIDDKKRVTIPAQFRDGLGPVFYLCKAFGDKCLWLMPSAEFHGLLEKMKARVPKSNKRGQRWITLFTSSAIQCRLDRQNRIQIPSDLMEYASLNDKVRLNGAIEKIEIWPLEKWQKDVEVEDFEELSADMCAEFEI